MTYHLDPIQELLNKEDPQELTDYLDEVLHILVQHSEHEGHLEGLGHRYYLIRELRNALIKVMKGGVHGD